MFNQVKGYAKRETAQTELNEAVSNWPSTNQNSPDWIRAEVNSLMFASAQVCLF